MLKLQILAVVHLDYQHLVLVVQIQIQVLPVILHHLVIQVIQNMVSYFHIKLSDEHLRVKDLIF